MKRLLLLALASCASPPPSTPLQQKIETATVGFRGEVGVYVRHFTTGETAALRPDELFPTASLVKIPILLALFDRIAKGGLDYHKPLVYDAKRRYDDEFSGAFRDGSKVTPRDLCFLMISASDNTASLWLQELAGTGVAINGWLARGFEETRVNSRTPGREKDREALGWGETTPREMAELFALVRDGRAAGPGESEEIERILGRSYWDGEALSQIPPRVRVLSKQGAVNKSRSETAVVHGPSGDYVFCVITRNQADESWDASNEGFELLRRISRILWQHFEPGSAWKPAPGSEKYR